MPEARVLRSSKKPTVANTSEILMLDCNLSGKVAQLAPDSTSQRRPLCEVTDLPKTPESNAQKPFDSQENTLIVRSYPPEDSTAIKVEQEPSIQFKTEDDDWQRTKSNKTGKEGPKFQRSSSEEFSFMGCMAPGKWLTDEPINSLISIIATLGGTLDHGVPRFAAVSSFHATAERGQQSYVKNLILSRVKLLLPLHHKDHWMLAVIDDEYQQAHVFNSLENLGDEMARGCAGRFLDCYFQGDRSQWRLSIAAGLKQYNGHDCGIMTVAGACFLVTGHQMPHTLDGELWRLVFHYLLQACDKRRQIARVNDSEDLKIALFAKFGPPALPTNFLHDIQVSNFQTDDRYFNEDLEVLDRDAKAKIHEIDELMASAAAQPQSLHAIEEILRVTKTLQSQGAGSLGGLIPYQPCDYMSVATLEACAKSLKTARCAYKDDQKKWQQLHAHPEYRHLTVLGLQLVDEKLRLNKQQLDTVSALQGMTTVVEAMEGVIKAHQDGISDLKKAREDLVCRRHGLKKLRTEGGGSRHLKRSRSVESI